MKSHDECGELTETTTGRRLDSVHFQFQTAQLLSECESKIAQIVAWAQRNPSADIELQGYLDQREALNKYSWDGSGYSSRGDALSELRARLVRDALIAGGLEKSRVRLGSGDRVVSCAQKGPRPAGSRIAASR